ncbi:MAG: class I SAM-dependent methyltransferase [Erysipelotrichales bacterium]|nr:class I SAM-dependent methyltransferase [Erysipelotrichales bacterium]
MTHYFTDNRSLPQNRKKMEFRIWGFRVYLITDNGVFSKEKVDFGSELLLSTLTPSTMSGKVLDVGCGYGTIGLSIKVANPELDVTMVDVNDRALELTELGAKENGVTVTALKSHCYENVSGTFQHIITNPPIRAGKDVVYSIFEGAHEHLDTDGCLWVVIRKQQGAPSAIKKLEGIFGNCTVINKDKGYFILKCIKK